MLIKIFNIILIIIIIITKKRALNPVSAEVFLQLVLFIEYFPFS